jgi:hypothetical protein
MSLAEVASECEDGNPSTETQILVARCNLLQHSHLIFRPLLEAPAGIPECPESEDEQQLQVNLQVHLPVNLQIHLHATRGFRIETVQDKFLLTLASAQDRFRASRCILTRCGIAIARDIL